jgi:hypothetical protein
MKDHPFGEPFSWGGYAALITASKDFKGILLLVDEPESGISLSNQKRCLKPWKKLRYSRWIVRHMLNQKSIEDPYSTYGVPQYRIHC